MQSWMSGERRQAPIVAVINSVALMARIGFMVQHATLSNARTRQDAVRQSNQSANYGHIQRVKKFVSCYCSAAN